MRISSAKPIFSACPTSNHLPSFSAFFFSFLISASIAIHAFSFSGGQSNRPSPSFASSVRPADAFRVASYQCRRQKLVETTIATNNNKNEPMLALKRVAEVLREAAAHNIDLVVFPEMFFSFASGGIGDHSSAVQSDRYELNIVGDLCAELGVACALPYMERAFKEKKKGENTNDGTGDKISSNTKDDDDDNNAEFYSAVKIWSSDGKTAGNIRAIIPPSPPPQKGLLKQQPKFLSSGHPSLDMEPITINLDNSETPQIKCGIIIGFNDIERPEQARHLARKGVDLLIVPSLGGKTQRLEGLTVANHVIPTRAMENSVYVAYAAYEGDDEQYGEESIYGRNIHTATRSTYVGSSSVVAPDGSFLVKGPTCFGGKIPPTEGFVLSLGGDEASAAGLYAADISLKDAMFVQRKMMNSPCQDGSLDLWDMVPRKSPVVKRGETNEKVNKEMKSSSANSSTSTIMGSKNRMMEQAFSSEGNKTLDTSSSPLFDKSQSSIDDTRGAVGRMSNSSSPSTSAPFSSDTRVSREMEAVTEKKGLDSPYGPSSEKKTSRKTNDGRINKRTSSSGPSSSGKVLDSPSTQSSDQKQSRKKDNDK